MSGTATTLSRKARREEAHRKLRQRKIMTTAVFVIGFMLVVWAVYTVVSIQQRNKAALDYTAADIVYDKPIQASHEMGAGAAIPFLPRNQPQPAVLAPEKFYDFGQVGPQDVVEREF
ncbi:MAG: hypothetical protein IAE79_06735, partial [Anaerolinea sp.]|nr:hypothetical protein [Anaerolinea sp.]